MIAESAHLPAYRYFGDDFDVSAVFDVNAERAEGFARRNNIKSFYIDADEMFAQYFDENGIKEIEQKSLSDL